MSDKVTLYEVGPRDGLQNEAQNIATDVKLSLIARLKLSGLKHIEATSFVSPKWVPQMADHNDIMAALAGDDDIAYPALVPNMQGMEAALAHHVKTVAIFTAASESFTQKNINCSINESIERFAAIAEMAQAQNVKMRGYVSCVAGCPYEGKVSVDKVVEVSKTLYNMGCYEISLGDTIGVGTPNQVKQIIEAVKSAVPIEHIALHCHDTYGQALANIYAGLDAGIRVIDSAIAGLGGCPYAKGASGNVATEDVAYMLRGLGMETGVDLERLIETAWFISDALGRKPIGHVANALKSE
jgi:hydroxymethylglutaryl-CoA lyase